MLNVQYAEGADTIVARRSPQLCDCLLTLAAESVTAI
jgi:hypothetical protein